MLYALCPMLIDLFPFPTSAFRIPTSKLFPQIQNRAFPKNWIQEPIQNAGQAGVLHDVPGQEPMIQVYRSRIRAVHADQAFEPPERGVQTVGIVATPQFEPETSQIGDQFL